MTITFESKHHRAGDKTMENENELTNAELNSFLEILAKL